MWREFDEFSNDNAKKKNKSRLIELMIYKKMDQQKKIRVGKDLSYGFFSWLSHNSHVLSQVKHTFIIYDDLAN